MFFKRIFGRKTGEPEVPSKEENNLVEPATGTKHMPSNLKDKGKLFVGGLNHSTTSEMLRNYFSQFGKVLDAVVLRFPKSGKSRGFGFITFINPVDATCALQSIPHIVDGKTVDLRPFSAGESASKAPKKDHALRVFIGGLPPDISSETLKQFFERFGEITEVFIPLAKNTNKPKGFGFINFKNEEDMQKCLAEKFIYLGGRRTFLRRAEPRSTIELPVNAGKSESADGKSVSSLENTEALSAVSSVSGEINEEDLKIHKLFEDYFSLKFENFNKSNEIKTEKVNSTVAELEKLLVEHLASQKRNSNEDLSIYSDDSELEESSSSTDIDSNYDEINDENNESLLEEFDKILKLGTSLNLQFQSGKFSCSKKSSDGGNEEFQVSAPFKFKDENGSLFCSLCEWAPPDKLCESFLAHCKTATHKEKLKERFMREQCQTSTPEGGKAQNLNIQKAENIQTGTSQKEVKNKLKKKQGQPNQAVEVLTKSGGGKKRKVKTSNTNLQNVPNNKSKYIKAEKLRNLKTVALTKGISCICPFSDDELQCGLCNKIIPKAKDPQILITNVSRHLQSRIHLINLLSTENLLAMMDKSHETEQKNNPMVNPIKSERKKENVLEEKKVPKKKDAVQKNINSKKVEKNSKSLFLCIPCNYFNSNFEVFKGHLHSQFHLNCFSNKGVKEDFSLENLTTCKNCGTFLYGSEYYIYKHYNKCSEKNSANT